MLILYGASGSNMYCGLQSTCNPAVWNNCAERLGACIPLIPGRAKAVGARGATYVSQASMACSASRVKAKLYPSFSMYTAAGYTLMHLDNCAGRAARFDSGKVRVRVRKALNSHKDVKHQPERRNQHSG